MTKQERRLWYDYLKKLPLTVHRQKTIGNYIVDFYIADKKLAIEIDGEEHFLGTRPEKDAERTIYLNNLGIKVVRYSNYDVTAKFREICDDLDAYIFFGKSIDED